MAPLSEEQFDQLLTRELGAQLNGQLGRAERGFLLAIEDEEKRQQGSFLIRLWPVARMAATIAIAVGVTLAIVRPDRTAGTGDPSNVITGTTGNIGMVSSRPDKTALTGGKPGTLEAVERELRWSTSDDGVRVGEDGTSMRQIRLKTWQRVQYFDPQQNRHVEMIVPKEEIVHYELQRF